MTDVPGGKLFFPASKWALGKNVPGNLESSRESVMMASKYSYAVNFLTATLWEYFLPQSTSVM